MYNIQVCVCVCAGVCVWCQVRCMHRLWVWEASFDYRPISRVYSPVLSRAMLCYAMLCYAMLSQPSSTLPVFEETVLVAAGGGWKWKSDESWQRRKQFAPFLCRLAARCYKHYEQPTLLVPQIQSGITTVPSLDHFNRCWALQTGNTPQELQFWRCSDPVV